jgi:outer membrane murein-binding lipoprotein Lpp
MAEAAMVEASLEFLGAEVQRLQGEVAAVKNSINVLNQDILAVRSGMVGLVKTVETLASSVADLARGQDAILQEMRAGFTAVNGRLDRLGK